MRWMIGVAERDFATLQSFTHMDRSRILLRAVVNIRKQELQVVTKALSRGAFSEIRNANDVLLETPDGENSTYQT